MRPGRAAGIRAELEARCAALQPVLLPLGDALPDAPDALAARFVSPAARTSTSS